MNTEALNVIVVDNDVGLRESIPLLLRREGMHVAGVASDLYEARNLMARCPHGVALIDVRLGTQRSTGLVEESLRRDPDAAVVLYTWLGSHDRELTRAANAGVRGFVLKPSPPTRLIHALRTVATGGRYVDPRLGDFLTPALGHTTLDRLSSRERQILGMLADGMTGKLIADKLHLAPETVRTHLRNATGKLHACTRAHAVAIAVREDATFGRAY